MKRIITILSLGFALMFISCKKETDSEILAHQLQSIIKTEKIERVLYSTSEVGDPANWEVFGDYGTHYSFNPPFVTIESHKYNLTSLKTYEIVTISQYKCMVLVF